MYMKRQTVKSARWQESLRSWINSPVRSCVRAGTPGLSDSCDPTGRSPPGSSARGILQARIVKWIAIFFSKGSSRPKDRSHISYISCVGRKVLYHCRHLGSQWGGNTGQPNLTDLLKCWLSWLGKWLSFPHSRIWVFSDTAFKTLMNIPLMV